ncbi:hypothetical protein BOTBODRAFT_176459 [Botryobasidium botryosum FD-172 SS1]|uniref:DUF6589 domain-containing protein n=1 Tax=Botryobasidium botryosum (strain FD-172 SS1) TaxID=930990 RepID=A0A067MLR5_BOTB1|nr:hypothetical protein BOTBODRAFT_176459 [Botryobasidium botryosum FD-172 SS1]
MLAADAQAFIKVAVTLPFLVVYDNINIRARVIKQRITNHNAYHSRTAATLLPIWGDYPPSSSAHDHIYIEPHPNEPTPPLHIEDLMIPSEKIEEMNEYFKHLLLVILCEHSGEYFSGFSREGNINILNDIYVRQLGLSPDTIPSSTHFVHGDLLTIKRLHLVTTSRGTKRSEFQKMDWAYLVFGLFHGKMAVLEMMLKAHLRKLSQSDPAMLSLHLNQQWCILLPSKTKSGWAGFLLVFLTSCGESGGRMQTMSYMAL